MSLSVVIVTFNSAHCIAECVNGVARVLPDCELIVVDNMSSDATLDIASATDARPMALQMGCNAGFGRACNTGVRRATREHVLLVNPDVVLVDAVHDELEAAFAKATLGLMAAELVAHDTRSVTGAPLFPYTSWSRELVNAAIGPFEPHELSSRRRAAPVGAPAWASAAVLLLRRSEFVSLGGFDERFFLYYEDQELGARYRRANLPIQGTAAIRAIHAKGASSPSATEDLIHRRAWCLLSWLEFVAMRHGAERARMSWLIVRRSHRVGRAVAALLARGSQAERMRRKAAQMASLEEVVGDLARGARDSRHGFCPVACKVVADVP